MPFSLFGCSSKLWFFSVKALKSGLRYGGMEPLTRMVWHMRVHLDRELNRHIVLSRDFVEGAVRLLVTRFIPLTPKDLERWEMDVEEWMNQEENEDEQWEYELRVCSPSLYPPFVPNRLFPKAVCGARTANLVHPVQRLRHSYPTSILRQRCRYVAPFVTQGPKLIDLSPIIPGAVRHSC
jgi:hypothetical protein